MPATLADVAERAGVSEATASRVLNRRPYVSAEARARVEAAVNELDYLPNRAAKGLSTARTATIAFVVHHAQYPAGSDGTFGARVLEGASRALLEQGFDLLYTTVEDGMVERLDRMSSLRPGRSDGAILLGPAIPRTAIEALVAADRPTVLVDNRLPGDPIDSILAENAPAAEALTRHLVEVHGARRLACLAGPPGWPSTAERVAGFQATLTASGLRGNVLHAQETTMRDGAEAATRLLDAPPDAVVAVNDAMAIGALHVLRTLPAQRRPAVVGFDDMAWATLAEPPLTTVAIDAEQMGVLAAERIVAAIDPGVGPRPPPRVLRVASVLRIRRSCGCP